MTPVKEITKYHVRLPLVSLVIGMITFLSSFTVVVWKVFSFYSDFEQTQVKILAAVTEHSIFQDSMKKWHQMALVHRANSDDRVKKLETTQKDMLDAMNMIETPTGVIFFTERKKNGHLIIEKYPPTTK